MIGDALIACHKEDAAKLNVELSTSQLLCESLVRSGDDNVVNKFIWEAHQKELHHVEIRDLVPPVRLEFPGRVREVGVGTTDAEC